MKITIISVGSRGDVEPFCAAADGFLSSGYDVNFFVQSDYKHLVPTGCVVHELPFTSMDFYKYVGSPSHGADHPNPRVKFIGIVTDVIGELVLPCWKDLMKVDTDLIITPSLARPLSFPVGTKKSIPVGVVHLQPLAPTNLFPHYSNTDDCVKTLLAVAGGDHAREENADGHNDFLDSYLELEQYQYDFLRDRLKPVYNDLGLELISFEDTKQRLTGHDSQTLILNSYCAKLIPPLPDVGSNVYEIGALADSYIPKDWKPPTDLVAYLENVKSNGVLPICVGYGSMPVDKVQQVMDALKETNSHAVVVGDAFQSIVKDGDEWVQEHIFMTLSVPYAWLLPWCSMMLCHGGAGVVMASLKAGAPPVISPLMGDQFTWAKLLEAKGLGAQAGASLTSICTEDLVKGIEQARECYDRCQTLSENLSSTTSGPDRLKEVIEIHLAASQN